MNKKAHKGKTLMGFDEVFAMLRAVFIESL